MHGNIRYHLENTEVCSWRGSGFVPSKWPGCLLMKVWSFFLLQLVVSFTKKCQDLYWGSLYPFMKARKWVCARGLAPCCTSCSTVHFQLLTFWVQSWSHYTVGKSSKFMCNTLVCIISFLAYALIIKYLRGRVEGIQAKKVPLRLALIITPLFKCLFSPSHKRHSKIFGSVGCIHLEGFLWAFPNH